LPFPHNWIAGTLNVSIELLEETLLKCKKSGRIYENNDGIKILNWGKYQSEYDRQKPYRQQKQRHERTPEQEQDSKFQSGMAVAKMNFRQKHNRQPTNLELIKLHNKVSKEVYGTRKTNALQE